MNERTNQQECNCIVCWHVYHPIHLVNVTPSPPSSPRHYHIASHHLKFINCIDNCILFSSTWMSAMTRFLQFAWTFHHLYFFRIGIGIGNELQNHAIFWIRIRILFSSLPSPRLLPHVSPFYFIFLYYYFRTSLPCSQPYHLSQSPIFFLFSPTFF